MANNFQYRFKIHNTQQKAFHSKLFWPKSTILISRSAKYRNVPKFVTEIFKFKINLSPEVMNGLKNCTSCE